MKKEEYTRYMGIYRLRDLGFAVFAEEQADIYFSELFNETECVNRVG